MLMYRIKKSLPRLILHNTTCFFVGVCALFLLLSISTQAANVASAANGNWSATAWPNTGRTGTITTSTGSVTVTGTGTLFLTELSVGNIIKNTSNVVIGTIAAINSNTSLTLTGNAASNNTGIAYRSQGVGPVDVITINSGHDITIDGIFTCASITISGSVGTTISFNDNSSLNCTGNLIMTAPTGNVPNLISVANGSFIVGGTSTLNNNNINTNNRITEITLGNGSITFTGAVALNARGNRTPNASLDFSGGSGIITFGAAGNVFSNTNGVVTLGTSTTHIYNNVGAQTVFGGTYFNLTLAGGGAKTVTGVTVNGTLTRSGIATVTGTPSLGASSTLAYRSTSAQTTGTEFISPFPGSGGILIENAAGVTLGAARSLAANPLRIGADTANSILNDGGFQLTATGALEIISGSLRLGSAGSATTYPNFSTNTLSSGTTIEYLSGVAQTISTTPSYQQLVFSGAGTKTIASGTLTVNANWSTNGGAVLLNTNNVDVNLTGNLLGAGNITSGSGTLQINGNWLNSGSFTPGTGTVVYNNSSGGQTVGGVTYNILTLNNTSGTQTAANNITAATLNTTAGGVFNMSTFQLTVTTVNHNGVLQTQNTSATPISSGLTWVGDVFYNAASEQTVVSGNYNNLNLSGGNRILSATGTIGIAAVLTPGSGTYTVTGSTVDFNGTGNQSIPDFDFANLIVSGNRSGNTITFANGGTIGVSGTFILTATSVSYIVTGNTFNYNGTNPQIIVPFDYNVLIISNSGTKTIETGSVVNCAGLDILDDAKLNIEGTAELNFL